MIYLIDQVMCNFHKNIVWNFHNYNCSFFIRAFILQGRIQEFFHGGSVGRYVADKYLGIVGGSYGGGFGGASLKKRWNMKCSRSDSEYT